VVVLAAPAGAQDTTQTPVPCAGQVIRDIVVFASAPTVTTTRRVPVVGPIIGPVLRTAHVTTNPELIRRYLLLHEGERCTELRRVESERLLRAQPFIADAAVVAIAHDDGGVRIEVRTVDEASVVFGARAGTSPMLRMMRLGSDNLMGEGVEIAGEWRSGGLLRDGWSFSATDHQFLGRPHVLALDVRRSPLGGEWRAELAHPFYTDLQRYAWQAQAGDETRFIRYQHPGEPTRARALRRRWHEVGAVGRVGPPRRFALVGMSVTGEEEFPGDAPVRYEEGGVVPDSAPALQGGRSFRMARVNLLGGVRFLDYLRVRGFDGLSATQDFPVGVQLGTIVGRSAPPLGAREDDWSMAGELYVGRGTRRRAVRAEVQGEVRWDNTLDRWDGLLSTGRIAQYLRIGEGRTIIATGEWTGAWRSRVPYSLALGSRDGGMRGYGESRLAGAQRAVVRIEDRRVLGRPWGHAETGAAWFLDLGRVWRGEVPYGVTTPVRVSLGAGFLAAVPIQSARLWRLDLAAPIGGGSRWELRISNGDRRSLAWRVPADVIGLRQRTVPGSVFDWP
jgi:hypothetical protein